MLFNCVPTKSIVKLLSGLKAMCLTYVKVKDNFLVDSATQYIQDKWKEIPTYLGQ